MLNLVIPPNQAVKLPIVRAIRVVDDLGLARWRLLDECPFCGRYHQHNAGPLDEPDPVMTRMSHCYAYGDTRGGEYELTPIRSSEAVEVRL